MLRNYSRRHDARLRSRNGMAGFRKDTVELLKTNHVTFRPIAIADLYNSIIPHVEVNFRHPRRDHAQVRIWRVPAKNTRWSHSPCSRKALNRRGSLLAFTKVQL